MLARYSRTLLLYLHWRYMQVVCEIDLGKLGFLWGYLGLNIARPLSPFVDGPFPLSRACGLAGLRAFYACGLAASVGRGGRLAAVPGAGASHPLGLSLYDLFRRIFKQSGTVAAGDISARHSSRWLRLDPNTLGNRGTRRPA